MSSKYEFDDREGVYFSSIENFQPELQLNSELKVDEIHITPCQCEVV